jgi:hypothetical protein
MKIAYFLSLFVVGGLILSGVMAKAQVPPPNAWYQAESNANDSIGTNNGVIKSSFSFVPGHNGGQAFSLAGGSIAVADAANLDLTTNLTVQFWVKGVTPNPFQYILAKNGAPAGASYAFYTGGSDGLYFWVDVPADTGYYGLIISPGATPAQVWDNNWHQVTGVYDGAAVHLYIDGVEVGSGTPTTTTAPDNGISYSPPGQLVMGNLSTGGSSAWSGLLDDVKVFARAFTADDAAITFTNANSSVNTNALSSWWKAEGNALDSVGVNHGTITASTVSFIPGKSGAAFLSAGGAVVVPDAPAFEPSQSITVQSWVKSVAPGSYKYILAKSRLSGWSSYALYTAGNGGITFYVSVGDSGNGTLVLSPSADPGVVWDGAWHQVTGMYDGAAVRLFVDGLEVGTGTAASGPIDYVSTNLNNGAFIMANDATLAFNAPAEIDDVKIWDSALTAQQVAQSFTTSGGLISWWRAEQNANDSVSSNNGTTSGSLAYSSGRLVGNAFNTAGGAVVVPDSSTLKTSAITVEAMVNAVRPGTNKYLISKSLAASGASYALSTGPNGGLSFYVNVNGTIKASPAATPAIWDGSYHIVDGTYDGSSVRLFVDGVEVGSGIAASGSIQYGTTFDSGELLFGDFSDSLNSSNFVGLLDEIKIYGTALSAQAIAANAFQPAIIVSQPQSVSANSGGSATFTVSALPASAVYQWSFNGNNLPGQTGSSLVLTNISQSQAGNYRVAVSVGAQYVTNSVLGGLAFRLPNANIDIAQNASLEPDGSVNGMTVQMWVRGTAPGAYKYLLTKTFSGGVGSYALYTGGNGGALFYIWLQGGVLIVSPDAGPGVWDGNWHQLTGVYDGQVVRIYVDGQQVGSGTDSLTGGSIEYSNGRTANGDLVIGDFSSPPSPSLFGRDIDEVKLFDHALTDSDVATTFANQNSTVATNGLLGWWRGEGNAFDSAGSKNGRIVPPGGTVFSDIATLSLTAAAALFQNPHVSAGNFQATLAGPAGQNFVVQRASSLASPSWVNVATNTLPFTFSDPVNGSNAFYRAVSQP